MHRWIVSGRRIGAVVSASVPSIFCLWGAWINQRALRMTQISLSGRLADADTLDGFVCLRPADDRNCELGSAPFMEALD